MDGVVIAMQALVYNGEVKRADRISSNEFVIINNLVWILVDAEFVNDPNFETKQQVKVCFQLMSPTKAGHSETILHSTVDRDTTYQTLAIIVK